MELFPFFLACPVLFAPGSVQAVGVQMQTYGCKKPLILFDKGIERAGIAQKVIDIVAATGLDYATNNAVESDPSDISIDAITDFAKAEGIDGIIALGGGSTIDTAKCVKFLLRHEGKLKQYYGFYPGEDDGVPLIAVPTTAGTGSEVTIGAVVTDSTANIKVSVANMWVKSAMAIIDPELTVGCPPKITAACAFDVLSHVIDGCTSNHTGPLIQNIIHNGIPLFMKSFRKVYEDGTDLQARSDMHMASLIGGIAILDGYVQACHGFAHTVGAMYHVMHGAACAMFSGPCLEYVADLWPEEVRTIAQLMEVDFAADETPTEVARKISVKINTMARSVDLPSIVDICPDEEAAIAQILPVALQDAMMMYCPRPVDEEGGRWILHRAFELAREA